ncbi:MAG: hypothetical protein AB1724_11885 [Thermodesulfobacteriota bacterium]
MKQAIIIIVLVIAGYFAYQHFFAGSSDDVAVEEEAAVESDASAIEQPPPIPESCKMLAGNLENAIYGNIKGQTSFAQRNTAYRKFHSCLSDAGFTDPQINGAAAEIEARAKRYAGQDGG